MELQIESEVIDFHQLVTRSLNSIWIVGENGEIFYCNQACLALLKLNSPEDILHRSLYDFLPSDIYAKFEERLKRVLVEQKTFEKIEGKMIRNDKDIIDVEVITAPYYLADKVFALVIIQDITHRKLAEKLLKDREKLASLGQVAAGIAHEVKNPLTTVKGFLQLMKESISHPYLDIMESELNKAVDTLENLLQVSKPDLHEEPSVPIDFRKELTSLVELFQDRLYNIEIEMDLGDYEKRIMGKRNLFLKAFFNLIKNAQEAIQGKGKIRIEHYYHSEAIHIKVSDTGIGIPGDKLKMLGTPFFSSKSEGTGLGLTQVYTTIHEYGGNMSVHSTVGKGTTFHVQLPVGNT